MAKRRECLVRTCLASRRNGLVALSARIRFSLFRADNIGLSSSRLGDKSSLVSNFWSLVSFLVEANGDPQPVSMDFIDRILSDFQMGVLPEDLGPMVRFVGRQLLSTVGGL